ncbi:MAG: flagellar motor switch protein FliY [Helicobacteraceae bacterium]|jgi:flagellar motor switch protein FliN/FliY|nr:flagellar motor switch protein FliY [Helicobacteraceae bacterium]
MRFIEILQKEMVATVNGLLGKAPDVSLKEEQTLNEHSSIVPPATVIDLSVSGAVEGIGKIVIPPQLATGLSDMMLGGEGATKDTVDSDDLDAIKEIVSQIAGALSSSLNAQNELPKLTFKTETARFIGADEFLNIAQFAKMFTFHFKIGSIDSVIMTIFDRAVISATENKPEEEKPAQNGGAAVGAAHDRAYPLTPEEIKNVALLMDVRLTVRVRIGRKQMLLRDVINMDIGSIVELNQLANEALDILVDNKKIAEGEVVIVDGNFGVQITAIGTKRERLEQLKS